MAFEYLQNLEGNSNPVMLHLETSTVVDNQPERGDAVTISAGLAVKAGASDNIIGIAVEDTKDNMVLVIVDNRALFRVPYTGSTKTTLVTSDKFTSFDLSNAGTIDLDSTSKGQFTVLSFDNINKTAVVKNNVPII